MASRELRRPLLLGARYVSSQAEYGVDVPLKKNLGKFPKVTIEFCQPVDRWFRATAPNTMPPSGIIVISLQAVFGTFPIATKLW